MASGLFYSAFLASPLSTEQVLGRTYITMSASPYSIATLFAKLRSIRSHLSPALLSPKGLARRALIAICAVVVLLYVLPLPPLFVGKGLDPSWQAALHVAFERKLVFGSQIIFSYGPFGFTQTRTYWPGLFWITMSFWGALGIVLLIAIRKTMVDTRWPLTYFLSITSISAIASVFAPDALVIGCFLLAGWSAVYRPHSLSIAYQVAVIAAFGLTKIPFLVAGFLTIVAIVSILLMQRRRPAALTAMVVYPGTLIVLWIIAGQPLSGLISFLIGGSDMVGGYADAMSISGPISETIGFIVVALSISAVIVFDKIGKKSTSHATAVLFTAALLIIGFKQGFTRHDGHALIGMLILAYVATIVCMQIPERKTTVHTPLRLATAAACVAILVPAFELYTNMFPLSVIELLAKHGRDASKQLAALAIAPDRLRSEHNAALVRIRAESPLPDIRGSVDIYSYDQSVLFSHNLDWNPRPAFQSYSAYTPRLARLNQEHLIGTQAPTNLLVAIQPIDSRLPALEDGSSWIEMIRHYSVSDVGQWIHLKRRSGEVDIQTTPYKTINAQGWTEIPPTSSGELWQAAIRVRKSSISRLREILLAPPMRYIELRLADGSTRKFRLPIRMAESPFLLSPLVDNSSDFARLFGCNSVLPGRTVKALRVITDSADTLEYEITLNKVTVSRPADSNRSEASGEMCALQMISAPEAVFNDPWIIETDGSGLNAHPPTVFRVLNAPKSIEICTRMRKRALVEGNSDGYVVSVVQAGREERLIERMNVLPKQLNQESCITSALPPPTADSEVQVRIEPGGNSAWDWVYVSKFKPQYASAP